MMRKYDATNEIWLDNEPVFEPEYSRRNTRPIVPHPQVRERMFPRLSLIQWLIIGPMVIALGFLAGINI